MATTTKKEKNKITKVQKRTGEIVPFQKKKIEEAIFKALTATNTGGRKLAKELADKVVKLLNRRFKKGDIPTVEQIQDIVEEVLILEDLVETAKAYILYREKRRNIREAKLATEEGVGLVDEYLKENTWEVKENSNMAFSLQGLNHYVAAYVSKKYWLNRIYPAEIRKANESGDFHIHNLDILATYCCGWDLYDVLLKGFGGVFGKIQSKPPKHFRSALGQVVNYFYTLQGESAGAQAFSNFDTLLAPFIRYDNLSFSEVKQALQEFLFNCNVPTRVGFQTPFENITLDLKVPNHLKDLPVIIGGQPQKETYGDFQEEMNILNQALTEVYVEGDATGRVFTFPIPTYNITKDFDWTNESYSGIWQMTAKYGIPYFCLDENTEVITAKGVKKIKDISLNDYLLSEEGNFIKIKIKTKTRSSENIILEGEKFDIICSFNHRFPTKEGIKKAEELTLNDRLLKYNEKVILETGMILDNYNKQFFGIDSLKELDNKEFLKLVPRKIIKHLPRFEYSKTRFQSNLNEKINIPKDLNEELMELIGIILGDGSLRQNGIRIVNGDEEILNFVKQVVKKEFKINVQTRIAGHSKICKDLSANSVILVNFFRNLGLNGNTYSKRIPEICYWRSEKEIGALLRGLFDTDGSINLNRRKDHILSISFANAELMNDVLVLLAKIGIAGKINKLGKKGARLVITGARNIGLFKKKVGFRIKKKNDLLRLEPKDSEHPAIGDKIVPLEEAIKLDNHYSYQGKKYFRVKANEENVYLFISRYEKNIEEVVIKKIERDYNSRNLYDVSVDSSSHLFVLKNGIISHNSNFINSDMKPEDSRSMCCRLRLDNRELYKRGGGLFGANPKTGSIGVVTINLPRIGYLSKTKKEFFDRLENLMNLAKSSLEIKRKILEDWTEKSLYPYSKYYLEEVKKLRGCYWGNHFSTIGIIGMNEALLNFMGVNIADKNGIKFATEVLDFMREKLVKFQEETGNLYNLEATPAEGTSYRLALKDKNKYPDIITSGEKEPYYTNSTQLPVNYTDDLFEALKLQDGLQTKYSGGTVFHAFLGESISDSETVKRLIKTIFENFKLPYFTLTPTFSICPTHGYLVGEHFTCPKCAVHQPCEVYSRIVGYLRPVQQWHKGKQEEFNQRKTFKV